MPDYLEKLLRSGRRQLNDFPKYPKHQSADSREHEQNYGLAMLAVEAEFESQPPVPPIGFWET